MKAMILAAGRGERMRPLTDHCPKPLLEAGGKPLIVWHIERLRAAGFTELVINHAHLGELLEAHLGDGSAFGVRIAWSAETRALETAGGIRQALPLLGKAPFIVINGDVFCDADFTHLRVAAQRLHAEGELAHLLMVDNPAHNPAGDFALGADGRLSNTAASDSAPSTLLTFSGLGAYHPALFEALPEGQPIRLAPLLRDAMQHGRISGEHHPGLWIDVGTPARLAELDSQLRHQKP